MVLNFCLGNCEDLEYNCRFSTQLTVKLHCNKNVLSSIESRLLGAHGAWR